MELVLSPGRLGGSDGSGAPFQNEEVREWSHVDRLTGMLERARVETGRWQARHQGAAQAYGKLIDSRERNSADGSVVQKARRQVEVFQSQGAGGRSVQVVRASQWSSSKVTDSTSSSPVPISMNEAYYKNGIDDAPDTSETTFGRLQSKEESGLSRLSQVSRLCRQIHAEALQNVRSSSLLKSTTPPATTRYIKPLDVNEDGNSSSLLNGKKSTSNEDISNTNEKDDAKIPAKFTRDCKARRSLQIPKTLNATVPTARKMFDDKSTNGTSVRLSGLDHRTKVSMHDTENMKDFNSYALKTSLESDKTMKLNVPGIKTSGRQIKSYVLGMENCDNGVIDKSPENSDAESRRSPAYSFKSTANQRNKDALDCETYDEYLRPVPTSPSLSRSVRSSSTSKANTTVVHLRNSSMPRHENSAHLKEAVMTIRPSGVKAAGNMQCRIQCSANRYSPRNSLTRESEMLKFKEDQTMDGNPVDAIQGHVRSQHSKILLSDDLQTGIHSAVISNDNILHDILSDKSRVLEDEQVVVSGRLVKKAGFSKTSDCRMQSSNRYSPRNSMTKESEMLKFKEDQTVDDNPVRHSAIISNDNILHDVTSDTNRILKDEQVVVPGRLVKMTGFSKTSDCRMQPSNRYSPRNSLTRESEVLKFTDDQTMDDNPARHSVIVSNDNILHDISSDKNRVLEDEQVVVPSRLMKKAGFSKISDCRMQSSNHYSPRNSLTRESEVIKFKENQTVDDDSVRHSVFISNDSILHDISSDKNRVLEDDQVVVPGRLVKKSGLNKTSDSRMQSSNRYSPRNSLTRESEVHKFKEDQTVDDNPVRHSAIISSENILHDITSGKNHVLEDEQVVGPDRLVKKAGFSKTSDCRMQPSNRFSPRNSLTRESEVIEFKEDQAVEDNPARHSVIVSNDNILHDISSDKNRVLEDEQVVVLGRLVKKAGFSKTSDCRMQSSNRYSPRNSLTKESEVLKFKEDQTMEINPQGPIHGPVRLQHSKSLLPEKALLSDDPETVKHSATIINDNILHNTSSEKSRLLEDEQAIVPGRLVKKVGFSKTEVHFAADSGKVNIVMSDGKPPPTNKFRRRRRNSLVSGTPNNKNLPLIHFGDTSYEKFIFGQSNSALQNDKLSSGDLNWTPKRSESEVPERSLAQSNDLAGWGVRLRSILEPEHKNTSSNVEYSSNKNYESGDKTVTDQKHRGHTTTVNFGADVPSKAKHIVQVETGLKSVDELVVSNNSNSTTPPYPNYSKGSHEESPVLNKSHENNVVSSDNENNQVLLNVVTTHEPIIARVEKDHSTKLGVRHGVSHSAERDARRNLTKGSRRTSSKMSIKQKAKDYCDSSAAVGAQRDSNDEGSGLTDPTYVNVFEPGQEDARVYENCQIANDEPVEDEYHTANGVVDACLVELRQVTDDALRAMNGRSALDNSSQSSTDGEEDRPRKSRGFVKHNLTTISENKSSGSKFHGENHRARSSKSRSERSAVGPTSSTSSIESVSRSPSRTVKSREMRYSSEKSSRTGRLRETSNEREASTATGRDKGKPKESHNENKVNRTRSRMVHSKRYSNLPAKNAEASKDSNGSTSSRLNKPIEIVYQTAVFNMKNEKLSKPTKVKESKSPRYINDLICGGKSKRPVEGRHVKDTGSEKMECQTSHRLQFIPSSSKKSPH